MRHMRSRRIGAAGAVVAAVAALAGCGGDAGEDTRSSTLTVFAAASLTTAFEAMATEFEATHEGVEVELGLGGSSDLAAQIREGAPADVFAAADEVTMDSLVAEDLVAADPVAFASNTLQIAVPPGNPAGVETLEDLATNGVAVVVCAPEVPCGAAAAAAAEAAGVVLEPVSEEPSVTDVLGKVVAEEADAGLVYVTDVLAAGDDVEGIAFPEADSTVNVYPIAPLPDGEQGLAREFIDLVLSDTGQGILGDAGFAPPPDGP